jgi:hypothetical protein
MHVTSSYLIALAFLVLFWIIYRLLAGTWNPFKVICGADGRPSTSKLQFWLWTIVVLFSYVALYAARVQDHKYDPITEIPANLLIAMGFAIVTATAAKGITTSFVQNGDLVKPPASPQTSGASQVLKEDDGSLDLSKIQMLAWTVIGLGVYLILLNHNLRTAPYALPNIDSALMVLMGLGQGAYLGKKLVTTDVPRINGITPQSGAAATVITLKGDTFGQSQSGSIVTIDGQPMTAAVDSWADTEIKFKLPANHPNGKPLTTGQVIQIGVIVNGRDSATRVPFTVS